jgi:hypothetical protein
VRIDDVQGDVTMRRLAPIIIAACTVLLGTACAGSGGNASDERGTSQPVLAAESVLAQGTAVPFRECASDPDWEQPPFGEVFSKRYQQFYYIRGIDTQLARAVYGRHIYMVGPGGSMNIGWSGISGLNLGGVELPGCPTAYERGTSGGRTAMFALVHHRPTEVVQKDDAVVVKLREEERGWTVLELSLNPALPEGMTAFFLDRDGNLMLACSTVGCDG